MTRVANYTVDFWLVFGSFVYGFEGRIIRFSEHNLEVCVEVGEDEESESLTDFFDDIVTQCKGLVRIELRIYPNSQAEEKSAGLSFPVQLMTCVSPLANEQPARIPSLVFSQFTGLTEADRMGWEKLVREIWS